MWKSGATADTIWEGRYKTLKRLGLKAHTASMVWQPRGCLVGDSVQMLHRLERTTGTYIHSGRR